MSQITQLDRIDALLQIGQLPSRYAFACDSRDMDALVALYVDDVTRPDVDGVGRSPLKAHFTRVLSGYYRTMHQIVGHQIDLASETHATGKVYCRAEHERGDDWVDMAILCDDEYERRDGVWYFAKRFLHMLHVTSRTERPRPPFVPVPTDDRVAARVVAFLVAILVTGRRGRRRPAHPAARSWPSTCPLIPRLALRVSRAGTTQPRSKPCLLAPEDSLSWREDAPPSATARATRWPGPIDPEVDIDTPWYCSRSRRDWRTPAAFDAVLTGTVLETRRCPIASPAANAFAERFVRTVRHVCLDHLRVVSRQHFEVVARQAIPPLQRRPRSSVDDHATGPFVGGP